MTYTSILILCVLLVLPFIVVWVGVKLWCLIDTRLHNRSRKTKPDVQVLMVEIARLREELYYESIREKAAVNELNRIKNELNRIKNTLKA